MANLSIYSNATNPHSKEVISFELLIDAIKNGKWEDQTHKIRIITDDDLRVKAKKKLPAVTFSGEFEHREDEAILKYSNLIQIDVDKLEPNDAEIMSIISSMRIEGYKCPMMRWETR